MRDSVLSVEKLEQLDDCDSIEKIPEIHTFASIVNAGCTSID
jgi:hypothetical protein